MGSRRRYIVAAVIVCVAAAGFTAGGAAVSQVTRLYTCVRADGVATGGWTAYARTCSSSQQSVYVTVSPGSPAPTTTQPTTSTDATIPTTTTLPVTTTTAAPTTTAATTTTQPGSTPAFLSRPSGTCGTRLTGANVTFSNRTLQGCAGIALTVANATNVTLTNLDFANNVGDIYLVDVTGNVTISGIRARNTGNGNIGSGQSNVIQLSRTRDNDSSVDISNVKTYGGNTEDVISVYQSGGTSATNTLLIEDVHMEHPLSGAMAWSSDSGTCINLADDGGSNILLRNSTFLNCAAVGIQMNEPQANVRAINNIVYGAARPTSNVGLSQWADSTCASCAGNEYRSNRVWWVKANGSASAMWLHGSYPVADIGNVKQDTTINPASLKVAL